MDDPNITFILWRRTRATLNLLWMSILTREDSAGHISTMYQHWTCLPFDGVATAVTAALSQLSSIYETTKESSKYVKYTMETAKEGVKEMVGRLDSLVCSRQHDKLEETCPVIFFTKPTEEVVEEPKKEYDSTLKPHVDQTVATNTSVGKVSAATQYAVDSVKDYSATKVSDATNYTYVKLGAVATYDDMMAVLLRQLQDIRQSTNRTVENEASFREVVRNIPKGDRDFVDPLFCGDKDPDSGNTDTGAAMSTELEKQLTQPSSNVRDGTSRSGQDSLTDVTCNILKLTQIVQQQIQASGKGSTFPIILTNDNYIEILIGDRLYRALIDTGASRCVVSRNVVNELEEWGVH